MRPPIDVPFLSTKNGKYSCVPTCTAMLFAFFGRPMPIGRIAKEMGIGQTDPAWLFEAGNLFLKRGFEVTLYGCDDIPSGRLLATSKKARRELLTWCKKSFGDQPERGTHYFLALCDFARLGGRFETERAFPHAVHGELYLGNPVMLAVNVEHLWENGSSGSHAIIATGISGGTMTILDPALPREGYPLERVSKACLAGGGVALVVKSKGASGAQ